MNPGATLIIVFGIIGLLLYASQALKSVTKEHFAVVDESQLSTKASTAMGGLDPASIQSILGAFTTPDLQTDRPTTSPVRAPVTALPVNKPAPEPVLNERTISDVQGEQIVKPSARNVNANDNRKPYQAAPRVITKIKKVYLPRKCPPVPDLSDYIRKDSIPCYGCNLK